MALAIGSPMIKKILLSVLVSFSFSLFAADEPSGLYAGLKKIETQIEELSASKKTAEALNLSEAEQALATYENKLAVLKKELQGLKQQFAADIDGDEKPQVMGRKATEYVDEDFKKIEKELTQSLAIAVSTGVMKTHLESMKQKKVILDFSVKHVKDWRLAIKGNFKNFPEQPYQLNADEPGVVSAMIRTLSVEYVDKDKKQVIEMGLGMTTFLQTFAELKSVLKTGVPMDPIHAVIEGAADSANFKRAEPGGPFSLTIPPHDYYYSLVSIEKILSEANPAE